MVSGPGPRRTGRSAEIVAMTRRSKLGAPFSATWANDLYGPMRFRAPTQCGSHLQVMLTGATMYALAIGSVSQIIAQVVHRHSISRRIERHAEVFITMHKLPQDLSVQVNLL